MTQPTNPASPTSPADSRPPAPGLHPEAAARFRDYTLKPVTEEQVNRYEAGTPTHIAGTKHLHEQARRQSLRKALHHYTGTAGLTVTPIHFPVITAGFTTPDTTTDTTPTAGLNSDGRLYFLTTGDPTVTAKTMADGSPLPGNYTSTPGKNPVLSGYTTDPRVQARTPEQADHLWSQAPWNVGIVTGPKTGTVVIDVDARHGGPPAARLLFETMALLHPRALPASWPDDPNNADIRRTFGYSTSAGGYHLLYTVDRDNTEAWALLRRLGGQPLKGVEIKSRPGMVVAAPSLHASGQSYRLPNPVLPPSATPEQRNIPRRLSTEDITALLAAVTVLTRLHSTTLDTLLTAARDNPQTIFTVLKDTIEAYGNIPVTGHSTIGGEGRTGFAALSQQAHNISTASTPEIPATDSPLEPGYYSRQVEYWLATGTPFRQFGPGEHHDSLKGLIGAIVKLVPITETMANYYVNRIRTDPAYIPPIYASLAVDIDEAVTSPEPWHRTDPENFAGILRYTIRAELESMGHTL